MIRFLFLTFFLFFAVSASAQQKKPAKKKQPTPVKKTPTTPVKTVTNLEEIQKQRADSLKKVEEFRLDQERQESIKREEDERRKAEDQQRREEEERIRTEEVFRRNREEAEAKRLAEERRKERENRNKFGISLKLGGSLSTLTTSELGSINKKNLMAPAFSVAVNIPINKFLSLSPEINYLRKGLNYEYDSDYDRLYMDYVVLPVLLSVDVLTTPKLKTMLKVGGYGGYWLSGKYSSKIDSEKNNHKYEFDNDFEDGFKDERLDYGVSVGLKQEFKFYKKYKVFIEGRYDYGLKSVSKFENNRGFSLPYNRTLSFWIGLGL